VTTLWISFALLTVFVLLVIVFPLVRKRPDMPDDTQRTDYDVALYKDQLKEVERDLERGILNVDQADAVRTEIQRKLLHAADAQKHHTPEIVSSGANGRGILTATAIVLFVVIGAAALYARLGSPELKDLAYADRDIKAEERSQQSQMPNQQIQGLLEKLARRLEENPNDIKGWLLLGRSFITSGRYEESAGAFERASALAPDDPDIMADYAEALIFANKGQVNDAAMTLLQGALGKTREDPKSRYYIGLYKAQKGNVAGALQDWVDIAAMSPSDAPWLPSIHRQIDAGFTKSGIDPSTITPSAEAQAFAKAQGRDAQALNTKPNQNAAPGPTAEDVQAAQSMSSEDQSNMIRGMVNRLAERLKSEPDDLQGWTRLARAYEVLGEKEKAKEALARVKALQNK